MSARVRSAGFSMVELLVATALTGILLAGVATIFIGWRSGSTATERMSQVQNRGRRALDELSTAIRSAGFPSCSRTPLHGTLPNGAAYSALRGHGAIPGGNAGLGSVPGSDVLEVQVPRRAITSTYLQQPMHSTDDVLHISSAIPSAVKAGDLILIHSCEARDFFIASSVDEGVITPRAATKTTGELESAPSALNFAFGIGAELLPIDTTLYYVGRSASADGSPSLFRRRGQTTPEEIVAGIAAMHLRFGVDDDGDDVVDAYRVTQDVRDWSAVLSVALTLTVHASDPPSTATQAVEEPDRQETFSAVVGLRNRAGAG